MKMLSKVPLKKLALSLFVLGCLSLAGLHLWDAVQAWDANNIDNDMISAWDRRLQPIKEDLPAPPVVIGYIGDWDIPGVSYQLADVETEYVLTQYALAPIIVERGDQYEWTFVNLSKAAQKSWLSSLQGDYQLTEYGNGIYLLHRTGP